MISQVDIDAMGDDGKLLPCPFCGGDAVLYIGMNEFIDGEVNCECGGSCGNHPDKQSAITAWNTRAAGQRSTDKL